MKTLLFANTDWYLYNFRLPLARALRGQGVEVTFLSPDGPYGARLRAEGFRWLVLPMRRRSLDPIEEIALVRRLVAIYREERPDLAHHFTLKCVVYGSLAARLARLPAWINAVAGLGYVFSSSAPRARLLRPLLKQALRHLADDDRSRLIVQNGDDRQTFVTERLADEARVRLIRGSGVDTSRFAPPTAAPAREARPLRVLFASRLLQDKGADTFVAAARALRGSVRCEFLLAGAPDEGNPGAVPASTLDDWAREGAIRVLGHVEHMERLLKEVDVAVLPTTYGEGVPRILIEAAACGIPIVATDVPGCREIVRDGVNGYLVPPRNPVALADRIGALLGNAGVRARFGRAGRALAVDEFDEGAVIAATLAVYAELLPTRFPGPAARAADAGGARRAA